MQQSMTVRITGHGMSTEGRGQRTANGPYQENYGEYFTCSVSAEHGNSGSPIIDEASGYAIGVFNTTYCPGYFRMAGTSFLNDDFWKAVSTPVDQKREDGSRLNGTYVSKWSGSSFISKTITNEPVYFPISVLNPEILKGDQSLNTNPTNEKYNQWFIGNNPDNDVKNHHSFSFDSDPIFLTSQFKKTYTGITIKNNLEATGVDGGSVEFKDPWFIDFPDPAYGNTLRNGGMDQASWRNRASPFSPNSTTLYENGQKYNGVFLDQSGPPLWSPPYYTVRSPQEMYLSQTGRTHKFYLQSWTYDSNKLTLRYPTLNETPLVFKSSEATTLIANLKVTQLSNTSTAYNTAGQRKYIRTSTGMLYNVYESLGDVYVEKSTDNGGTWSILNNGQPINVFWQAQQGSSATIAISYDDYIYVAYQSSCDVRGLNTTSVIVAHIYQDNIFWQNNIYGSPMNSTTDLQPVMSAYNGGVLVVVNPPNPQVLHPLFVKKINVNSNHTPGTSSSYNLPYTDSNSNNASIVWDGIRFHLAFESQNYQIKYIGWFTNDVPTTSNSIYSVVSDGSGYYNNQNPSISLTRYFYPIISWVGKYYGTMNKAVLRRGVINNTNNTVAWDAFYNVGSNVTYVHSNSSLKTDEEQTVLVWNEGSTNTITKWVKKLGVSPTYTYSTPASLSPAGSHTQITTGSTIAFMRAIVFNNSTIPYYFTKSSTEFNSTIPDGGLNKITDEDTIITFGRSGVASINDIEFVFNLGDVLLGNKIIEFINVPDTISYLTANDLNQSTSTNNFELNSSSELIFSNIYYVVQKSNPDTALTATDAVNFKVELVNALTNQVVGTFDNITYNKNNVEKYASIDYSVDCSGIAEGEYYLRLITSVNGDALYTLSNIVNDNTILAKKNFNNVNFTGTEIPANYALAQNFPNPFNPSTTIRYQIPQDGIVTLKIYDILGSEVATLVNEEKVAGRYEVNFNASSLASGVYIYKLQAGSFINSKKMILLK